MFKKHKNSSPEENASRVFTLLSVLVFAILGLVLVVNTFAAPGGNKGKPGNGSSSGPSLYILPSSQKVAVGDTIRAAVWVDTAGQNINTVQADVNYDTRYLEFIRVDTTGSAFGIDVQAANNNGLVQIARGSFNTVNGQNLVATVEFRATSKSRNAKLSFASSSAMVDSDTYQNILTTTKSATVSIR